MSPPSPSSVAIAFVVSCVLPPPTLIKMSGCASRATSAPASTVSTGEWGATPA